MVLDDGSCVSYWIPTLRDDADRAALTAITGYLVQAATQVPARNRKYIAADAIHSISVCDAVQAHPGPSARSMWM